MELATQRDKQYWIDNLRAIACLMVILLHVSGPWVNKLQNFNSFDWWNVNLLHTISRFCVPVFVMITGALVIGKISEWKLFYKQKMGRVLRPLVFWSVFYILFYQAYSIYQGENWSIISFFAFVVDSVIYGAAYHLWYLYLILALYLFVPILSAIVLKWNSFQILLLLVLWILVLATAQYFETNKFANLLRFCFGYMGYMLLGYYIVTYIAVNKTSNLFGFAFVLLGIFGTIFSIYKNSIQNGSIDYSWYYYLNVNVLVLSAGVFITFRQFNTYSKWLSNIAKHSFGIYLIHLFYIMVVNRLLGSNYTIPVVFETLLITAFVGILSYSSIILMKRSIVLRAYVE